jgi:hypothetical protein
MNIKLVRNKKKNKMAIYSNDNEDGYISSSEPHIVENESDESFGSKDAIEDASDND